MEQEKKICVNCKKDFIVDPEDFNFYEKIKVPSPTWCPECRLIRRFLWRNERIFYKAKCNLCGKNILSVYFPEKISKIYCYDCWWSDKWQALDYGQEYNFSKLFFKQYEELLKVVPVVNLWGFGNINCEYAVHTAHSKNIYYCSSTAHSENVFYSYFTYDSKDIFDSFISHKSELCYEGINSNKCFSSSFIIDSDNCLDSWFLYNCKNCQNCILSSNLRHKKFYIENKPYSEKEYFEKLRGFNFNSFSSLNKDKQRFKNIQEKTIRRFADITNSINCIGDDIHNSRNAKNCFRVDSVENIKYCWTVIYGLKDSFDVSGVLESELCYEGMLAGEHNFNLKFYLQNMTSRNLDYCLYCISCSNCFGCVGLHNKEYCILNKQYAKSEYEELVPKIIEHMNEMPYVDKKGRIYKYGEFFPPELSPFCYNETVAQEYFPLTKEQALAQGYSWKDQEERNISIDIRTEDLPDHIKDVKDDIIGKVIQCANANTKFSESGTQKINQFSQCTSAFKIIPQELEFYKKMNLPLPRLCPNCRHYQRLKQRNPLKLWHRQCMCGEKQSLLKSDFNKQAYGVPDAASSVVYTNTIEHFHKDKPCPNEFETSYAPDRPEIVYCEECYKREVE